ncbi:MAG: hypothetical protein KG029_01485 [Bacteroidetes bacterium]|jgi:hypothetical protein|nr:hypothetical protein [Bacteroidota bacterium]
MRSFIGFEIVCPNCAAKLAGKRLKTDSISFSELYSDGKMLCNGLLSTEQKVVICPSCSHAFWNPNKTDTDFSLSGDAQEILSENAVYQFSNWYLFGCDTTHSEGKRALIERYQDLLILLKPYSSEQEMILRKELLWAINDLVREKRQYHLSDIFNGKFNFFSWRNERKEWFRQHFLFAKFGLLHVSNIKRLIELTRISEEKDINRAFLAELYREKGNFTKTIQLIGELSRSTHYVSMILEKAKSGNSFVFKVAG